MMESNGKSVSRNTNGKMRSAVLDSKSNNSKWEYEADLDFLRKWLTKSATPIEMTGKIRKTRIKVQNLIEACKSVISDSEPSETVAWNNTMLIPRNSNPMAIDLIVKSVLDYLPRSYPFRGGLLDCRVVNKTWNKNAMFWIQSKELTKARVGANFHQFYSDFENTSVLPFTQMQMALRGMNLKNGAAFFVKHGCRILELEIVEKKKTSHQKNLDKLQTILDHVPNLKSMALKLYSIGSRLYDGELFLGIKLEKVETLKLSGSIYLTEDFLMGLFASVPNVKKLNMSSLMNQDWRNIGRAMELLHLDEISTSHSVLPRPLRRSIRQTQQLTKLTLNIQRRLKVIRRQRRLLASQSESLQALTLIIDGDEVDDEAANPPKLKLPVMTALTSLTLRVHYKSSNSREIADPRTFPLKPIGSMRTPNLKTLCAAPKLIEMLFVGSFSRLSELHLRDSVQANCKYLDKIANGFPNLKTLTNLCTALDVNDMSLICCKLANIEELELKILSGPYGFEGDFNLFIAGIKPNEKWIFLQLADRFGFESLKLMSPANSIRNWQQLKSLKLAFRSKLESCVIDEIGVYLAFFGLPPYLRLSLSGDFFISTDLRKKLAKHSKNLFLRPAKYKRPVASSIDLPGPELDLNSDSAFDSVSEEEFEDETEEASDTQELVELDPELSDAAEMEEEVEVLDQIEEQDIAEELKEVSDSEELEAFDAEEVDEDEDASLIETDAESEAENVEEADVDGFQVESDEDELQEK